MAQVETRNQALFNQFHASKGFAEWDAGTDAESDATERLLKDGELGSDENVVTGEDLVELHTTRFGPSPVAHTVDELPLREAFKKIRSGNVDEMLLAMESLESEHETHAQQNSLEEVIALAEELLAIANGHEERRVREAAANCGLGFAAYLRKLDQAGGAK